LRLTHFGLIGLVAALAAWRLTAYPAAWFDEGINLQAARNLAQAGHNCLDYAGDAADIRLFDLQLTTGPTVIGPVAAAFKLLGVGLRQGRLVMLAYTLSAALGLYLLGRELGGPWVGVLAVVFLCAAGEASPSATRSVVGEIAALAYLFWGAILLRRTALLGGLLLGLAMVSKGQIGLVIPAIVAAWWFTRPRAPGPLWRVLLGIGLPAAAWQLVQLGLLGLAGYQQHLADQRAALSVSSNAPFLSNTLEIAAFLLASPLVVLGLVGLLYVGLGGVRAKRFTQLWLALFGALWLLWLLGFSVGYPRYAIPLIACGCLFAAHFAVDLLRATRAELRLAAGLLVAVPVLVGLATRVDALRDQADSSAQAMGTLISTEVPASARVESLEWELDVLTDRVLHHPPPFVPLIPYAVPETVAYLVDGPASKATGLYIAELRDHPYDRLATAGMYDLYRRVQHP
jgi:hypothetical protein